MLYCSPQQLIELMLACRKICRTRQLYENLVICAGQQAFFANVSDAHMTHMSFPPWCVHPSTPWGGKSIEPRRHGPNLSQPPGYQNMHATSSIEMPSPKPIQCFAVLWARPISLWMFVLVDQSIYSKKAGSDSSGIRWRYKMVRRSKGMKRPSFTDRHNTDMVKHGQTFLRCVTEEQCVKM